MKYYYKLVNLRIDLVSDFSNGRMTERIYLYNFTTKLEWNFLEIAPTGLMTGANTL